MTLRTIVLTALALICLPARAHAAKAEAAPDDSAGAPPRRTLLAAGDTVSVPLDLTMRQPVVDVYLNGRGPFSMFLDTGAGGTVLDQSLAKELGLAKRGETRLGDPANPQAILADIVMLDSLRIGGAVFVGVQAASWDRSAIRPGHDMPRGVVGLPVFHDVLESIDFPSARLRLTRGHLGEPGAHGVIHYRSTGGIPMVPVDVAGAAMEAHLDTGSPGFLSIPEKDSTKVRFAGPVQVVGHGRTVNSFITFRGAQLDGAMRVGDASFDHPLVVLNDRLPFANLGSRALSDCVVTLDQSNERVRIARTHNSGDLSTRVDSPIRDGGTPGARVVVEGPRPGEKTAGVMLALEWPHSSGQQL